MSESQVALPSVEDVVAKATAQLFSEKLLTNIHRAVVVEAIVAMALEPDWEWCSGDYASYDFRRGTVRLEIKQSASLQSWNAQSFKPSKCSFDIAERTGAWGDDLVWKPGVGRNADIYLLCHHPIVSVEADHRDAMQWRFFIVPEVSLPKQKRISLTAVERLTDAVGWLDLSSSVEAVARSAGLASMPVTEAREGR
jgi:hypothetical protein